MTGWSLSASWYRTVIISPMHSPEETIDLMLSCCLIFTISLCLFLLYLCLTFSFRLVLGL